MLQMKKTYHIWLRAGLAASFLTAAAFCSRIEGIVPLAGSQAWAYASPAESGQDGGSPESTIEEPGWESGEIPLIDDLTAATPSDGSMTDSATTNIRMINPDGFLPAATPSNQEDQVGYAGTYEEMKAWLSDNCCIGGTLILTDDIAMDGSFDYTSGKMLRLLRPVVIDAGDHCIRVSGEVYFSTCMDRLTIRGNGRPDGDSEGLLVVEPGGELHLSMMRVEAGQGLAVYQKDGSVLGIDQEVYPADITGEIHYASPVLQPNSIREGGFWGSIVITGSDVMEELRQKLPSSVKATVNRNGRFFHQVDIPVRWQTEVAESALDSRVRTLLYGQPEGAIEELPGVFDGGYDAGDLFMAEGFTFSCLVVFPDAGGAFLSCDRETAGSGNSLFNLEYYMAEGAGPAALYVSGDSGITWREVADAEHLDAGSLVPRYPSFRTELPAGREYCFYIAAQQGSRFLYTDVIGTAGMDFNSRPDLDGTRGGGDAIADVERPGAGDDGPARMETEPPSESCGDFDDHGRGNHNDGRNSSSGGGRDKSVNRNGMITAGSGQTAPAQNGKSVDSGEPADSVKRPEYAGESDAAMPDFAGEEVSVGAQQPSPAGDGFQSASATDPAAAQTAEKQKAVGLLFTVTLLGGAIILWHLFLRGRQTSTEEGSEQEGSGKKQ